MEQLKESDWKIFRQLHPVWLEQFCRRILNESETLLRDDSESAHQRFLALHSHFHESNKEVARLFDDLRRSTAILQLTAIRAEGLMTDEEFSRFSEETQHRIQFIIAL